MFDKLTTTLGIMLGMAQSSTVDLDKLQTGSHAEQIKVLTAIAIAVLGWATNKKDKN